MDYDRRFEELEERMGRLEEDFEELEGEQSRLVFSNSYTNSAITFLITVLARVILAPLGPEERMQMKMRVASALNEYVKNLDSNLSTKDEDGNVKRMDTKERKLFIDGILGFIQVIMDRL